MKHKSHDGELTVELSKDEVRMLLYTLLGEDADDDTKSAKFIDKLVDVLEDFK